MENQTGKSESFKLIFVFYFIMMMILYVFIDDGGLATKS